MKCRVLFVEIGTERADAPILAPYLRHSTKYNHIIVKNKMIT